MVTAYHGDIRVDWTNKEWENLQKVKDQKINQRLMFNPTNVGLRIDGDIRDAAKAYAKEKGLTMSQLVNHLFGMLTEEN